MNNAYGNGQRVFRLEKASIEFGNVKVQMFIAFVLCLIACLCMFGSTLGTGFFLDDYLHLDYVARAVSGQPQLFLHNFTGNWAGSDVMKSYRPLVSLSFFIDYLLWHTNAFGYHLSNVLLFFGCCVFVALITQEISGLYGSRLSAAAAIWAGLLFAVYPLHPEAVAWPVGRVDVICGLFYLACLFAYLRFRLLREWPYFIAAIIAFLLSLTAKEMAATLPLVITLLEFTLPFPSVGQEGFRTNWRLRLFCLATFWLTLAAYATMRTFLIGTLVGGYSSGGLKEMLSTWRVFLDKPTLFKLVFPVNEEVLVNPAYHALLFAAYVMIALSLTLRLIFRAAPWRPFIFLLASTLIMVLPTFQVWHINPNLVGSRLFFISSAPFCIFIALAALPALDRISRRWAHGVTTVGVLCLVTIFASWSYVLNANLKPWLAASAQMQNLQSQIQILAAQCPPGKHMLLLNLPRDYSGAGMLTRPQYLAILAQPPFSKSDLTSKFITVEPIGSGSHDFIWPDQFAAILNDPNLASVLIWNKSAGSFVPWQMPQGRPSYNWQYVMGQAANQVETPASDTITSFGLDWHLSSDKRPVLEQYADFVRIHPGDKGIDVFFPNVNLNPLTANFVIADLDLKQNSGCNRCLGGKTKLIWQSQYGKVEYASDNLNRADLPMSLRGRYALWVGRFRQWTLNGPVVKLGLHFEPGQYFADLKGIRVIPQALYVPKISMSDQGGVGRQIAYDVTAIPGAHLVETFFTKAGETFDANAEAGIAEMNVPPSAILSILNQAKLAGSVGVPDDVSNSPGLHQVRVQAFDQYDLPVGYPSEPVTFSIAGK
jgi:hypothetical protein